LCLACTQTHTIELAAKMVDGPQFVRGLSSDRKASLDA